jgi:sirohydrochlorin cobaltochelatase
MTSERSDVASVDGAPRSAGASPAAAALVLFAHGSRDPQWAAPFREVQRKISEKNPALAVHLAFLEIMEPTLPASLERLAASGQTRVTIAPLFMAQGAHLKRDLARMLSESRQRHPKLDIVLLPAIGEAEPVLDAIAGWLVRNV